MVGVCSVGVDLSHPASEVGRVGTGPFPCHQNEATGADGGREDVACLFGQTRCFSPRGELLSSIQEALLLALLLKDVVISFKLHGLVDL